MDRKTAKHRRLLLAAIHDVRTAVSDFLTVWETNDIAPDVLTEDEFPFDLALEDMHARIVACIENIDQRTPHFPPTLTKRELIDMLEAVDCPDDTPIIGYTDVTDYVNVDGIGNTDFSGGDALVIETLENYDSRQW